MSSNNQSNPRYDLIEIINIMKQNKVLKVQLGTMIVELSPNAFITDSIDDIVDLTDQTIESTIKNTGRVVAKTKLSQDESLIMPDDTTMLMWSAE